MTVKNSSVNTRFSYAVYGAVGEPSHPFFVLHCVGEHFLGAGYCPVQDQCVYSGSGNSRE